LDAELAHFYPTRSDRELLRTKPHPQAVSLWVVLTDRFHAASDVDVLVEFESDARPTLLTLARLERELSAMIGRKVDLRMPGDLSRYFRDEVLASSSPQYERI
jgi:predicted nucleotidyltransferase